MQLEIDIKPTTDLSIKKKMVDEILLEVNISSKATNNFMDENKLSYITHEIQMGLIQYTHFNFNIKMCNLNNYGYNSLFSSWFPYINYDYLAIHNRDDFMWEFEPLQTGWANAFSFKYIGDNKYLVKAIGSECEECTDEIVTIIDLVNNMNAVHQKYRKFIEDNFTDVFPDDYIKILDFSFDKP